MRIRIKNLFLLHALIAGFGLMPAGRAQTFTTLHSFATNSPPYYTNSDGAFPNAGVILSGNTLYGTAFNGGSADNGTVFKINTDGADFTTLHSFTAVNYNPATGGYTNSDGVQPFAGLILSGNTLFGTAYGGGSSNLGTVFAVNTDGTGFTTLHSFKGRSSVDDNSSEGAYPDGGLILSGNTLFGTTSQGGSKFNGTVFKVNTDGTGFENLHTFTATSGFSPPYTNSDGSHPDARLVLSGNTLYGTAPEGGSSGKGTVFKVNTDGTSFTTIHSFTGGSEGSDPESGLILSGNTLFGTTYQGGSSSSYGTVFKVNTDGAGFTTLHSFTSGDGASPYVRLVLSDNTLYGTTTGGLQSFGKVFKVSTDGTGFTTLYSITNPYDAATPQGELVLSGNILYGASFGGGSSLRGTVFSLSLESGSAPQLTIIRSEANVILTWPTNAAGFILQCTTNLVSPATWTPVSPGPVVVNGHNTVTNPISGTQKFYRLTN